MNANFSDDTKVVSRLLNYFADINRNLYSKKFSKDVIEKMRNMNEENSFMPLSILKQIINLFESENYNILFEIVEIPGGHLVEDLY